MGRSRLEPSCLRGRPPFSRYNPEALLTFILFLSRDWLRPSVSLFPADPQYGSGPRSGRIDILSSRGNTPTSPSSKGGGGRGGNAQPMPLGFTSATTEAGAYYGPFEATRDSAGKSPSFQLWCSDCKYSYQSRCR